MLTEIEKQQCKKILDKLDTTELQVLKDTVTKNTIEATSRREAIAAILDYSESVSELLHRKKIKRDMVFRYLYEENVRVSPSSNKTTLVGVVLQYIATLNAESPLSIVTQSAPKCSSTSQGQSSISFVSSPSDGYSQRLADATAHTDQAISQEFIVWFYPLLNSLHDTAFNPVPKWSVNHFWPDCRFRCKIPIDRGRGEENYQFEEVEGAELVSKKLASFVRHHQIVFNVNDTPAGHRGRINPHGLAKVAACGTLHKITSTNELAGDFGTFEQLFGLLRDPTEDNRWKIKFSDLSIDGASVRTADSSLSEASMLALLAE